jgi:hypothetical protein
MAAPGFLEEEFERDKWDEMREERRRSSGCEN